MSVLEAKAVTKLYGGEGSSPAIKALQGIDLIIEAGEFTGIMGPSGSGKTTLLNVLAGLIPSTTGQVTIGGTPISSLSRDDLAVFRRRNLGFVFQDFNLLDSLTLKENILLPMVLDHKASASMEASAEQLLKLMDLGDAGDRYPWQASGGQVQRACIARALVNQPSMLFADEPTGNLDSNAAGMIMSYLQKIHEEGNHTLLMVTHDPFTASFCNRIVFIRDGQVFMEIHKKRDRKEFFKRILESVSMMGGVRHDLP